MRRTPVSRGVSSAGAVRRQLGILPNPVRGLLTRGLLHKGQDHEGREKDESDPHVGLIVVSRRNIDKSAINRLLTVSL